MAALLAGPAIYLDLARIALRRTALETEAHINPCSVEHLREIPVRRTGAGAGLREILWELKELAMDKPENSLFDHENSLFIAPEQGISGGERSLGPASTAINFQIFQYIKVGVRGLGAGRDEHALAAYTARL